MGIKVTTPDKKAEIARDVVVAYLSHVKDENLADLDQVTATIKRLVDVVDDIFEVPERPSAGFGLSPTIPAPASGRAS